MSAKSILAYLADEQDRAAAEEMIRRRHMNVQAHPGNVDTAIADAATWRIVPEFLILDVSGVADVEGAIQRLVAAAPEGETNLIAVGTDDCVEAYRRMKRLGVSEYLVRPLDGDALAEVIGDVMRESLSAGSAIDSARLMCVHAVRGGVGGSTIAAAVARAVSHAHGKRTFLIDLDLGYGTQHLNFGTDETKGLVDMCDNPSRIDALFMDRSLERPSDNLMLLSARRDEGGGDVAAETLKEIVIQAQRAADMVILDLPFRAPVGRQMLAQSGCNVLVTTPTIPGVRDTATLLSWLEKMNYGGQTLVALNQVGQFRDGEVARTDFAKRLGNQIKVFDVPFDPRAAGRAMVNDRTLFAATGRIARNLNALYAALPTAPSGDKKKKGGLRR